jgi:hypothetical protein
MAGSFQPVPQVAPLGAIAGLKQPSSRRMTSQTLGRRNAALVQSTELDLSLLSHPLRAIKAGML